MPKMPSLAAYVLKLCGRREAAMEPVPQPARVMAALAGDTLQRDLALAAEHVNSIRWLLEIARQHDQPIPAAALRNLELVSKHLGEMRRRIDTEFNAAARRPELQALPRPRPPSFGCHASPSGRSAPCG